MRASSLYEMLAFSIAATAASSLSIRWSCTAVAILYLFTPSLIASLGFFGSIPGLRFASMLAMIHACFVDCSAVGVVVVGFLGTVFCLLSLLILVSFFFSSAFSALLVAYVIATGGLRRARRGNSEGFKCSTR